MIGIDVSGMDEFGELLKDMEVGQVDTRKAMEKAIEPIYQAVDKNTPVRSGELQKSITKR